MNPDASYRALIEELREISLFSATESLLGWDHKTHLPAQGAEFRARQKSMFAAIVHQRLTAKKMGDWLTDLESSDAMSNPHGDRAVNVRHTRRIYDRMVKLPEELVRERATLSVMANQVWVEARQKADFGAFAPWLQKTVILARREAECIGFSQHPYDALLDEYEPGETTAGVQEVFEELKGPLIELVGRIVDSGKQPPTEILERKYPIDIQERLARTAATGIGFEFNAGRLDVSVHPFCSDLGPRDTRLTTRYDEHSFSDAFFGVLHETGHGLYQQGLPPEHYGTPLGQAISLGIHESQSRMWENLVGRGRPFWKFFFPQLQSAFGQTLSAVNEDQWYAAINDVRPSFIRVESDEATYNLHILLRFELEQALISGDLAAADVEDAWNQRMQKYLGITPPNAAMGALQDIHWSIGAIGYFPTYSLGNIYAAQFFNQARRDIADLEGHISRGEFTPLLDWLRTKIHSQGQRFTARELVKSVTGKERSSCDLLDDLKIKAQELYGV